LLVSEQGLYESVINKGGLVGGLKNVLRDCWYELRGREVVFLWAELKISAVDGGY
jgi:hypothetical protein